MDFLFPSTKKIKTTQSLQTVPASRFSVGSVKSIRSATLSELPTSEEVGELISMSKCPANPDHLFVSPETNLQRGEVDPHILGAELTKAILSKQYDTLNGLLQQGANPNYPLQSPNDSLNSEISADSPLFVAAMLDDVRAASELIDYGASITGNVAAKDIDFSPLGVAIKQKNHAVLELFLRTINSLYEVDFEPEDQAEEQANGTEELEQDEESSSNEENDPDYTEEPAVDHKPQVKAQSSPPNSRTSSTNSLPSPGNGLPRRNSGSNLPTPKPTSTSPSASTPSQPSASRPSKRQRED